MVMNSITIKYFNIGGVGFTADSKRVYEMHKRYRLNLKAVLPGKDIELSLKIVIIGSEGNCVYRAIYRRLTRAQMSALTDVAEGFSKGLLGQLGELTANIS
jgi:hypothetical protein